MYLWLISSAMLRQKFGEPDRLLTEFVPNQLVATGCFVTLVEQQVERLQNAVEPPRQLIAGRNLKWNVRLLDLLLCARQSLRNRRLSC